MTHTRNHHKTQGSQTHPGELDDAHSEYQLGTQCSRVRRCPNQKLQSRIHILENQRPIQLLNNTNLGVTWQTWHCLLEVPTNNPHSSKHKDNYFYGHNSRTVCNNLKQDTNLFPQKNNLVKSYNIYNRILSLIEARFHNFF